MTKKSFIKILSFGMGILLVSIVVTLCVFYSYHEKQVRDNLSNTAHIVASRLAVSENYDFINGGFDNIRLTLIANDGKVLADSEEIASDMENHSDRPEFKEAIQNGNGSNIRKSETIDEDTYYYAVRLDDNSILRVSVTSESIYVVFYQYIAVFAAIMLIVIFAAFAISLAMTKSIVNPIIKIGENLDDIENVKIYSELQPFVETIKTQKRKQKLLDKQKKEFTANVSHELKTPLTSIAGYAELIENGMAREENIKPFASTIRKQALRLVSLAEDIIQLSQLDEVEIDIIFEEVDLSDIAAQCIAALEMNAKAKNIALFADNEECFVRANKALLEELVYNLIDNAIRYNKDGGSVKVIAEKKSDGAVLTVKDTGIGIAEKYQSRIFERFFRVDKSRSKQTGGTGLGLAIVKHIAEVHNASITVNSTENIGTEIIIVFP